MNVKTVSGSVRGVTGVLVLVGLKTVQSIEKHELGGFVSPLVFNVFVPTGCFKFYSQASRGSSLFVPRIVTGHVRIKTD